MKCSFKATGHRQMHTALFLQFFCCLVDNGTMKKPDDEIPTTSYAGLSDLGHTPFKQAVEAELDKMAKRLHYTPDVFRIVDNILDGDEPGSKVVHVWCHENYTIKVTVPNDSPAEFAKALEAKLKEYYQYRERFGQVESGQVDSDTSD